MLRKNEIIKIVSNLRIGQSSTVGAAGRFLLNLRQCLVFQLLRSQLPLASPLTLQSPKDILSLSLQPLDFQDRPKFRRFFQHQMSRKIGNYVLLGTVRRSAYEPVVPLNEVH